MMLDLNVDTVLSVNGCNNTMTAMVDSLTSTNSKNSNSSISTLLNFSILNNNNNNVIEVEDVDNVIISNRRNELQLFPVAGGAPSPSPSPAECWLNLSVSELGISKKKSRRGPRSRSSQYRGVTFYRRTGRWESHIWDCGKQVYLGGFDTAHAAARAYDRAAIKFRGVDADINFTITDYDEDMIQMKDLTKEEFVHILRRHSNRFSRGSSKHRGVTLHKCGQWEATMGQSNRARFMDVGIDSNLDLNLGISLSSKGNDSKSISRFPCESPEGKRAKERAIGSSSEAGPLPGYSNRSWKIPSHGMVTPVPFLSSAASSGFSSATSPYYMPVLPLTSRATQVPAFHGL